jgi:hypothetical protein
LSEKLTDEEEDSIFETEPKLLLIGINIILGETISLLSVGVSKIRAKHLRLKNSISRAFNNEIRRLYVRPEISLEDKVYLGTYYHHSQDDIQVDKTSAKI